MTKLATCCGYRKIKAGQAWGDYVGYVRRLSKRIGVQPTEAERTKMADLKAQAASERDAYRAHCADETLEHK